jgi:hypothetical protein
MILENSKIYYGNSALLNKLKYYPSPYCLLLCCFLPWSIIFTAAQNSDSKQTLGWNGKRNSTSNRHATFTYRMGWNLSWQRWWINNDWDWKDIERLQTITDRFSKLAQNPY